MPGRSIASRLTIRVVPDVERTEADPGPITQRMQAYHAEQERLRKERIERETREAREREEKIRASRPWR
jgi:hypothetical protein